MEKDPSQNQRNLRRLLMSVQASYGRLNLLIAICDNWKYRDELISSYEQELAAKGTSCHRVRIDRQQPSLKQSLQDLVSQEPVLMSVEKSAIVTVLGADELLGIRLNEPKSAQEQFFFSAQWTREGLRDFKFPIVIWLTSEIATSLAQQAPDFWSWRGGVFEFSKPLGISIQQRALQNVSVGGDINVQILQTIELYSKKSAIIDSLLHQINELQTKYPDSPLLASLYNSLGDAYKNAVRYIEAEEPYRKALDLYEREQGAEYSDVLTSLNNLADLYHLQGRYAEAEPLYQRSLKLNQKISGDRHPNTTHCLVKLAELYRNQGKYDEAETIFLQVLSIQKKVANIEKIVLQKTLEDKTYEEMSEESGYDVSYLRDVGYRLWSSLSQAFGESINKRVLKSRFSNYLSKIEESKKFDSSTDNSVQVLISLLHGENYIDSVNNLAETYYLQGKLDEAKPLLIESLRAREIQLGSDHLKVAESLNNLAGLYDSQGKYSEAEPLYLRSLSIKERQLGADHPDVAQSLNNLATLYQAEGKYSEAEPLYLRSLEIWERQLGADHPDVATSLNNLAELYRAQGKYSEAEPLYLRSLEIRERQLGADHPAVATSLNNLAALYDSQGKYSEAEPLYVRAIQIFEKALGSEHPNTVTVRKNYETMRENMN